MQPESRKFLSDMLDATRSITTFTSSKTLADLKSDNLLRSAVYFQFLIIGEALSQLRTREPDVAKQLTESSRIVGFRNQIIHGYARIDDEITWRIIQDKLPVLSAELTRLLAEP